MYNLLASKWGRLTTFFFLYMSEGIPQGFAGVAVATQMRRQGVSGEAVGFFIATLYMPWAFKWMMGPFVDVLSSDRFGRRRMWIVGAQVMMIVTLLLAMPIDFQRQLTFFFLDTEFVISLFVLVIFIHNIFAGTQDVAIDALACSELSEKERGLANGVMFAAAQLGNALGGATVLLLTPWLGFYNCFYLICLCLLLITVFVAVPLREKPTKGQAEPGGGILWTAVGEVRQYVITALKSFFATRAGFFGLLFAALPAGSYALSMTIGNNLAVEFGMSDTEIGQLGLASSTIFAAFCVAGGFWSDRFGRRKMIAVYIALTAIPPLALAWTMQQNGFIMPIDTSLGAPPRASDELLIAFCAASLAFSVFNGLLYGTRTALFMDICNPAVAATQFTAYMSLLNLVMSYSAHWQGVWAAKLGYPKALVIDALLGMLCLVFLPLLKKRP